MLKPAQKRFRGHPDDAGCFLCVPLREQRGDRLFLLAPEF
jgi:hypothetical protein